MTRTSGEEVYGWASWNGQIVRIFVSHVNGDQWAFAEEKPLVIYMVPSQGGSSQPPGGRLTPLDFFHLGASRDCPHWSRHVPGIDVTSLPHSASARSTAYGSVYPQNTLCTIMVFPIALLLIKDFHRDFTAKGIQQRALGHGIKWFNHVLHLLEATGQILKVD